ncbi:probable UTP-glucose-1-phosphate uridylyltransferase [Rhynchosporium secalis]|uniref:UTP--glucose-1-phosphate uridylyltransferase n=1 Tax=Rhynchosporium secalis TaxID=38038 RepID=A0A1E1ME94_RHYSE|nr:probable UTP-glucose-1-phosphate uridylyltransferase [Rhynchosporium secalis]
MAALKNALPGHLKSTLGIPGGEAEFAKKHHGKTQSHMIKPLPKLALAKWKTGRTHCFYLPGICIHACPALPGTDEDLHYQPKDFAPDTILLPLPAYDDLDLHPALRLSRSATLQRRSGGSPPNLADLPIESWESPAFVKGFLKAALLPYRSESPIAPSPAMSSSPRLKPAAPFLARRLSNPELRPPPIPPRNPLRISPALRPPLAGRPKPNKMAAPLIVSDSPCLEELAKLIDQEQAFENTSTSVAASQMRNALNNLADTVTDPTEKKLFETEMDNFFALFRRYLNDKAKGNQLDWERIAPPAVNQVVDYNELANSESVGFLNKLAVLKLNGGLGTSMGCVGPKSVIEVREGMSFLDLSVRQIEYLNRTYNVNVPFVLMNSFNTDEDTQNIIKKYEGHDIDILTFNQSRYPRILKDSLLPAPKTFDSPISDWYPPGHGDVFESLYNSGILDKLIERGVEILFLSNVDNLGAVVDLRILQHMVKTDAEYIMELTDKTKADVKGGTIIDYEGSVRLLEIAQVPKEHTNEFKSIKKFKYFNTNNIWLNLKAVKRIVENNELEMEIIPNNKSIPADKKGESDVSIVQLETAVGAAIRHFKNAHGVNVPRRRFLPVKTCSDLMLVKSDLYSLKHGQLQIDPSRFGPAPLIKLGNDFKKVSDFQKRIGSIPKIIELDHLTITGAVNLGRGVTLKGTVIIVATEGSTIDIPPGSILENVVVQGSLRLLEH